MSQFATTDRARKVDKSEVTLPVDSSSVLYHGDVDSSFSVMYKVESDTTSGYNLISFSLRWKICNFLATRLDLNSISVILSLQFKPINVEKVFELFSVDGKIPFLHSLVNPVVTGPNSLYATSYGLANMVDPSLDFVVAFRYPSSKGQLRETFVPMVQFTAGVPYSSLHDAETPSESSHSGWDLVPFVEDDVEPDY